MEKSPEDNKSTAHGVERLIERLRDEGVARGRSEAEALIAQAERRARGIVEKAEQESLALREEARKEAERLRKAGEEALQLAARDATLKLRDNLINRFGEQVKALVGKTMDNEAVMEMLVREVARKALKDADADEAVKITVQLPGHIKDLEQLRRDPEALKAGTLSHFVLSVAADLFREGVSLETSEDLRGGIRVRLEDNDITVDLSEQAVAAVLLEHMTPRFRALLEGIIR